MSNTPTHRAAVTPNVGIEDPKARKAIYGVAVAIGAALVVLGVVTPDVVNGWLEAIGQVLTLLATVLALVNTPKKTV